MVNFAFTTVIFGLPLMAYFGMLTLLFALVTATLGYLTHKGRPYFPYHKMMAGITIAMALFHGIVGILNYLY